MLSHNIQRQGIFLSTVSLLILSVVCGPAGAATFEVNDGLRWTGEDDAWRVELDGRVHLDGASYSDDVTQLDGGLQARRLRPSLKLRFGDNWRARFDYEFADFGTGWKNAYVDYRGFDDIRLRFGHQLAPFGLEQQMSSNSLPLLERSLVQALTPGFEQGVAMRFQGRRWMFNTGIFDADASSNDARRADGVSYTGRFTFAPLRRDAIVLHLGASAEQREMKSGELRFSIRPESYLANQRLVDTGTLSGIDRLRTEGLEAAVVGRRCRLMGEYVRSDVSFELTDPARLDGAYASLGCLIAGERYRYRASTGGFRSTRASGRLGVMEVTLRRSRIDLSDAAVAGGIEKNWTLGLNWQLTDKLRVVTDYVRMDMVPNENGVTESADVVQARFQLAY